MADEEIIQEEAGEEIDIFEEYEHILAEYKRDARMRSLVGVGVSVLAHVILIIVGFFVIVIEQPQSEAALETEKVEMEVKEIPPEEREKIEELEEQAETVAPTVAKPEPATETSQEVEDINTDVVGVDTNVDLTSTLNFKPMNTGLVMPGAMAGRSGAGRAAAGRKYGIGSGTESAILKALRWLKRHQEEDGNWFNKGHEGKAMSGMALLAFLAHGDTPSTSEEFGVTVQKAIDYLVRLVEETGQKPVGRAYTHGIVAYALSEAYAMTSLPEVGTAAETAVTVVVNGQQPGGGYNYRYAKGDRWDLSVASWQFQAMKAASVAGLEIPGMAQAKQRGAAWLKNENFSGGSFHYSGHRGARWSMNGAGCVVLQLLGHHTAPAVKTVVSRLKDEYKSEWKKVCHASSYSWYYITQAAFHGGKSSFKSYFPTFSRMLIKHQADDGHWPSPNQDVAKTNRGYHPYMNTALNCLSLQVAFRYLPSYQTTRKQMAGGVTGGDDETDDTFSFEDDDLGIEVN